MDQKKGIYWRVYLIYLGFLGIMLLVLYKTVSLQMEGRSEVFTTNDGVQEKMPTRTVQRVPRRGEILDANLNPLITSVSFYDIHMDPTVVKKELFDEEVGGLAQGLFEMYPERTANEWEHYIRSARASKKRYLLIKRRATIEERNKLTTLPIFNKGRLKGGLIDSDETIVRKRPHGELLKRTLGYYRPAEGKTQDLKVGLEGAYNIYLAGENGEEVEQKYGNGWKKTGQIIREPIEGADIVTTIDLEIQEVAHTELMNQLKHQNAKHGSVIVMEVKTGYIKAMASLSRASDGNYYETFNHAIGTKEVPGSTFKLASLMALLEDKKVKITDEVNANGEYRFYNNVMKDHNGGFGKITIKQAFEHSSNVFTKIVNNAYKDNPMQYINRLRSFGLADSLGVDMKGEVKPTMYYPKHPNWSGLSLPWMAVGYEVQLTPMQIVAFYNTVANNGKYMKPQFVKEVRRGQEVIQQFHPIVLHDRICSSSTISKLKECLEGVMLEGTGKRLKSSFFTSAGKTGTARVLNENKSYGDKGSYKYQASFVGYFPADEPMYSCIVVISEPESDFYGAIVSGTVFASIANKVYASALKYHEAINENKQRLAEIPVSKGGNKNDLEKVLNTFKIRYSLTGDGEWLQTAKQDKFIQLNPLKLENKIVPNVLGMNAKDAVFLIEKTGMKVKLIGYGTVSAQSIPAGTKVSNNTIVLTLK
ncbi:MAG: transpeptidase family protein [Crocinitomicaceae bacterium]|nr:transpeptidase family protein [Crocinitomicaceae bacterium]